MMQGPMTEPEDKVIATTAAAAGPLPPGGGGYREPTRTILVVGGGVAGMHAALEAAALGHPVVMVEENLAIGGHMAQLDKTFPTQDCALCTLSPRLYEVSRNPRIRLLTRSRIDAVTGCAGRFRVNVTQAPGYVDPEKCIGCGQCHEKCPVRVPDPYNLGKSETKAVRALYPQAVPTTHAIDPNHCLYFRTRAKSKRGRGACRLCQKICPTGAIDFEDQSKPWTLDVGAIILAGGFSMLGAQSLVHPEWLDLPNVVSNLELERMLSSTGPSRGKVCLPGTDAPPERIAFLQCMGSRDPVHGVPYCSSVCCSASLKQATLLAANPAVAQITICYLDLRTHGRECEQFLRRVQQIDKIRFIAGKVGSIQPDRENRSLRLVGTNQGRPFRFETDLAVLAMGLRPHETAIRVAQRMAVELESYGFVRTRNHHPVSTRVDGIYACGTLIGPKSIPTTVQEAGAAAFQASKRLRMRQSRAEDGDSGSVTGFRADRPDRPRQEMLEPESAPGKGSKDGMDAQAYGGKGRFATGASTVAAQTIAAGRPLPPGDTGPGHGPRIGVFVCRCGTNIAGLLDTLALAHQATGETNVVWSCEELFTCSKDATERMAHTIREQKLNRVVVASCSPRTHLPIFQEVAEREGMPPGLVVMANIREQCAWVHADQPEAAQKKAKSLVRQAIDRARHALPVPVIEVQVTQKALIFGAGMAALTAAVNLADAGVRCVLVNRDAGLGGRMRHAFYDPKKLDCRKLQRLVIQRAADHPRIEILEETELVAMNGRCGRFQATLQNRNKDRDGLRSFQVRAGAILVAIGATTLQPDGLCGYGSSSQIVTQAELAGELGTNTLDLEGIRQVAMIQCVGSRTDARPYCSRSCCQQAIAHALELEKRFPHLLITILYRDIRTYGTTEQLYQKAREHGIQFLRYSEKAPPEVSCSRFGRRTYVDIHWPNPAGGPELHLRVGLLVLSTATVPNPWAESLASRLKLPLTAEGFFLEKHIKLAPVETALDGIYIAGQCHYPETLTESLVQGQAAAAKMQALLRLRKLQKPALTATIQRSRCSRCLSCYAVCPARAVILPEQGGTPEIDPMICLGCGVCAAECPARAIEVAGAREIPLAEAAAALME